MLGKRNRRSNDDNQQLLISKKEAFVVFAAITVIAITLYILGITAIKTAQEENWAWQPSNYNSIAAENEQNRMSPPESALEAG